MQILADNRFKNDEFEDIFSNSSNADEYEDIYSSSDLEDISSFSSEQDEIYEEDYVSDDFTVKYNSAVQNRRRQEIQYEEYLFCIFPPQKKSISLYIFCYLSL